MRRGCRRGCPSARPTHRPANRGTPKQRQRQPPPQASRSQPYFAFSWHVHSSVSINLLARGLIVSRIRSHSLGKDSVSQVCPSVRTNKRFAPEDIQPAFDLCLFRHGNRLLTQWREYRQRGQVSGLHSASWQAGKFPSQLQDQL